MNECDNILNQNAERAKLKPLGAKPDICVYPTIKLAFDNKDPEGRFCFSLDRDENGKKEFGVVNDLSSFLSFYNSISNDKNFYEVLYEDNPRYEYYDIDFKINDEDNLNKKTIKIFKDFEKIRKEFLGTYDENEDIYNKKTCFRITDSSKEGKVSLHIVNRNIIFVNLKEQVKFINHFLDFIKLRYPHYKDCLFDKTVYSRNRSMRMIYSSKYKQDRPLLPWKNHKNSKNGKVEEFFITNVEKNFLLKKIELLENLKFSFDTKNNNSENNNNSEYSNDDEEDKKIESLIDSDVLIDMLNKLSIERFTNYDDWLRFIWFCCRYKVNRKIIHDYCSLADNYDERAVDDKISECKSFGIGVGTIYKWIKDDTGYSYKNNKGNNVFEMFNLFENEFIKIVDVGEDVKYVKPLDLKFNQKCYYNDDKVNCICIKSSLGSGKTTSIIKYIKDNNVKRVLVLSPRQSFASSICEEYNEKINDKNAERFHCYLDEKRDNLKNINRLVISMESLHYLRKNHRLLKDENIVENYDLLVIDECESNLTSHICYETNTKNQDENIQVFDNLLKNSNKIIFCDAFLTRKTINFISNNKIPCVVYNYKRKMDDRKAVKVHPVLKTNEKGKKVYDEDILLTKYLMPSLLKGEKNYVFVSSKARLLDWKKILERNFQDKNIICYTGGSSVKNIRQKWSEADCVLTTSTITVGINFDIPDVFDNVFIYASCRCCNLVSDMFQSHYRVRHLKNNLLYYYISSFGPNTILDTNYHDIIDKINHKEEYFKSKCLDFKTTPDSVFQLKLDNDYQKNISIMDMERVFNRYLFMCGYKIIEEKNINLEIKELQEEMSREFLLEDIEINEEDYEYEDIPELLPEDYTVLINKKKHNEQLSEMEMYQIDKYIFKKCFIDHDDNDVLVIDRNNIKILWEMWTNYNKQRMTSIRVEKKITLGVLKLESLFFLDALNNPYACLQNDKSIKLEFVSNIVNILGVEHSQDVKTIIKHENVEKLKKYIDKNQYSIRNAFNLRDQRKDKNNDIDYFKVINAVLEKHGYTKLVKGKRKQKRVNGKMIDLPCDYQLKTDNIKDSDETKAELIWKHAVVEKKKDNTPNNYNKEVKEENNGYKLPFNM